MKRNNPYHILTRGGKLLRVRSDGAEGGGVELEGRQAEVGRRGRPRREERRVRGQSGSEEWVGSQKGG